MRGEYEREGNMRGGEYERVAESKQNTTGETIEEKKNNNKRIREVDYLAKEKKMRVRE